MSELNNHSQIHAQKKNFGAVQHLVQRLEQLRKDEKKALQNIDQQILDSQKFLETVAISSGNSVTYEEVFGEVRSNRRNTIGGPAVEKYRPTKSSVMKMEIQLRKSLAEARFKARSEDFFHSWKEVFEKNLEL